MTSIQPTSGSPVEAIGVKIGRGQMSFASAVKNQGSQSRVCGVRDGVPALQPRFQPIPLSNRQYGQVDGKSSVHFTVAEFDAGAALFRFSLIAKFTAGRPSIAEIREVFKAHWAIKGRATVSDIWDGRHVMIILDSEEDATTALTCPLRKIGHAMFRLFRYTTDYNTKKESSYTSKWVRLPGSHPAFMTRNYVAGIVNSFGYFLDLDVRTKVCSSMRYARACVEIDVSQPIPDEVQITLSDGRKFWQKIEVEGNLSYCSHCNIHGHALATCRKKRPIEVNVDTKEKATIDKAATTNEKVTTTNEKTTTSCPRKIGMNDPVKEQEWQVVNRKKKGKGKMEDAVQPLKEQGDNVAAKERLHDPRPIIPRLPELIVPREVMVKTADINTAVVLFTEAHVEDSNEDDNHTAIGAEENNDNVDKMALVIFQENATENLARNRTEDLNAVVDKVVEEETSPMEKNGDLPVVGDVAGGSAHEGMREQDRGSVAEVVIATNAIPSIDSSEDYVIHTREDGSIYCDVFGGKRFQDNEDLAKFAKENGFVIKNVPITSIEESGKGGEDREVIRNSDNESCDQVDQVDPQVPIISSQQRTRHRKKKGSRASTRSCPKKKDDNFVWP